MKKTSPIVFLLLFTPPTLVSAEIYKCIIDGKTIFSQNPCESNARIYNSAPDQKQTTTRNTGNKNGRNQVLLWDDPDLGIKKCCIYPSKDGAKNEYQMTMKMLDLLLPLAQDEKTKKEVESFRSMKLLDTCPSGAKIKCYPDLIVFTNDMNSNFTKQHIEDTKKTRKHELWYPNGKDLKKLSDSCSTGIFEILP